MESYTLENSDVVLNVHDKDQCRGPKCSVHNKTDHNLRLCPQIWFKNVIWRKLGDTLYPDPDSIDFDPNDAVWCKQSETIIKHNRLKCVKCEDIIESKYRHDFVSCTCGAVAIDGGSDYVRILGNYEDFEQLTEKEEVNYMILVDNM